jgi:hypothetical protein
LTADLIIISIIYRDIVDFRKKVATKEDKVTTIDMATIRIIITSIAISFKIRSIRFIIRLAIG